MKVICISAKARHGKDTAAEILKDIFEVQGKKVLIAHYADLVKYVCKTFFNWNGEKDDYGRTLLQTVGTDIIGAKQKDFWVNFLVSIFKFFPDEWDIVLIPDCRYPIEFEAMRANFDTALLRIERPDFDNGLSATQKTHTSETALDNYKFNTIIYNSGSLEELKVKLTEYANTI